MQRAIFDHLRAVDGDPRRDRASVSTDGYALTPDEADALRAGDVAAFHRAHVHPVLINMYCRANGWKRADYRVLFEDESATGERSVRWRTS